MRDTLREAYEEMEGSISDALYMARRLEELGHPAAGTFIAALMTAQRAAEMHAPPLERDCMTLAKEEMGGA